MYPVTRWIWVIGLCLAAMVGCGGGEQPKVVDQQVVKQSDVDREKTPEPKAKEDVKPAEVPTTEETKEEVKKVLAALPLFVKIEPGIFKMGSPAGGPDKAARDDDEHQHTVTISTGFWIASHEVTQELYYAVMKTNPSRFTEGKYCSGNHIVHKDKLGKDISVCKNLPVEQVSWNDAQEFITALNKIDSKGYRLPTESEWEYAIRGGHTNTIKKDGTYTYTVYSFGDDVNPLADHAWYQENSGSQTRPVGQKRPIEIGDKKLYDMHGNVWEWVQDWYGDYPKDAAVDPQGPSEGSFRVMRGGGWIYDARDCRSANRLNRYAVGRNYDIGFRLVRTQ